MFQIFDNFRGRALKLPFSPESSGLRETSSIFRNFERRWTPWNARGPVPIYRYSVSRSNSRFSGPRAPLGRRMPRENPTGNRKCTKLVQFRARQVEKRSPVDATGRQGHTRVSPGIRRAARVLRASRTRLALRSIDLSPINCRLISAILT